MKCQRCGKERIQDRAWWKPFPDLFACWGHPTRITETQFLKPEQIGPDDVFYVADKSEHKTKQLKIDDLIKYIKTQL